MPTFQHRAGVFAGEIRERGYRAWAATWPYLREPWESKVGPNSHNRAMRRFLRRWHGDDRLDERDMVTFELYPWHSPSLTANVRTSPDVARRFVLEPLEDLAPLPVFALGSAWFALLRDHAARLALEPRGVFGEGGEPWPGRVRSRRAVVLRSRAGNLVVGLKHQGSDDPPAEDEVEVLRHLVDGVDPSS
ncbi:MAG: hypothetical protein M3N16_00410 [Actinomycetota bacterium]|nr:hypothetical protein [Actinomycetota bacterium]